MAEHNELGKIGEETAAFYLEEKGYAIRERNWRKGHLELDIVAQQDAELVFVEVKTRATADFQEPQEAVDRKKIRRIVLAANAYIRQNDISLPIRFDIVTVVGDAGKFRIEHIEDAFYPPMFH